MRRSWRRRRRALERLQEEMQEKTDGALVRPSARNARNSSIHHRLAWLESFEPEGGLRAQVDAAARAMGSADKRAVALEALLASGEDGQQLWAPLPLFEDIARNADMSTGALSAFQCTAF